MTQPNETTYTRVDAVIECYEITDRTARQLLDLMPDAYGGEVPGEDDWPEPDSERDKPYLLSRIWKKLDAEAQQDIAQAVAKY